MPTATPPAINPEDAAASQFSALLSLLSPQEQSEVVGSINNAVPAVGNIWKGGIEPPTFPEFCILLDGSSLYPRQLKVFEDTGLIRAIDMLSNTRKIKELILLWGKGAGKDFFASKLVAYVAYCLLSIEGDPCVFLKTYCKAANLAPGSELTVLNVADTADTALRIFFGYLKRWLAHPIFECYKPDILTESILFYDWTKPRFGSKNVPPIKLSLYSMTSSAKGLEGYNCFMWIMDEADAFKDAEDKSNADILHDILRTSANTRMGPAWFGIIITYTRFEEGFAMRMYERAGETPEMYYRDRAATWDVNPYFDRNATEVLEMYRNNARGAAGMYECLPSTVMAAFFDFPERIQMAINAELEQCAAVVIEDLDQEVEGGQIHLYKALSKIENIRYEPGRSYFLGGDGGVKKDSFAMSVFSTKDAVGIPAWLCPQCAPTLIEGRESLYASAMPPGDVVCACCVSSPHEVPFGRWMNAVGNDGGGTEIERGGQKYHLPHVREELLIEVKPVQGQSGKPGRVVHFVSIQRELEILVRALHVSRARFDPHQTVSITQGLQANTGIDAAEILFTNTLQMRRASLVKFMLNAGLITLLPNQPKRDREWRRLQQKGDSIDHPKQTAGSWESKDLWDAESVAIWCAATYHCSAIESSWL